MFANNPKFDYDREPSRDILCIDCKSFYASVEAVDHGLDPLTAKLVVMSYPSGAQTERGSGLILASSPAAKAAYGISNVSRARDLPFPYPDDLYIYPPRMRRYMQKNKEVNQIYQSYVDEANHHVYSVDESFLDITNSLRLFKAQSAKDLALRIQRDVYEQLGIYTTIGIGDNPFLAKVALDNAAKKAPDMIAEWRYEQVAQTLWQIQDLTAVWGIGKRTARKLGGMGINTVYDLAHTSYYQLKKSFGVLGTQLYAHAWGIDRSFLGDTYQSQDKSIGNSQILPRDYHVASEIELVIKEMADQVATRLRRYGYSAQVISLYIGYSKSYLDSEGKSSFHKHARIQVTNSGKKIAEVALFLFRQAYHGQIVRQVGLTSHDLTQSRSQQLDLFQSVTQQDNQAQVEQIVDRIRGKYGFTSIVHAASLLSGGRAIDRSKLVGGHAGGMAGIEGDGHG
ncbi:Y-family DNA polymerase [Aerococcus kribbianus]|uniref:Y-family DNA polymerase n=1 Tax=Aerococcus kribbianus TaxID=2999064 RepID=A0A9X3FVR9_9LACT|nr:MULTISPECIES: Y-family DNA polymerase [unclassified Aerococcus]MCZ0717134.1 Y-family DNA polymerase [Aerococcus sp. YH-aer221]MCZ0725422.1 Y-family DNA polymerase [Aerococcus sp. YH-aer222]